MFVVSSHADASDHRAEVAFDDYPPYHYWIDGSPVGLNIDLINEVYARIGLRPHYVRRPWKRSLQEIESGEVGALCAGMKTPSREKFAYYPSRHLSLETNWVISLADSGLNVVALDDLKNLTVGVVTGYSYGPSFDSMEGVRKHERRNEKSLIELLMNKRIDVIVGCDLVIDHFAKILGVQDRLKYQLKLSSDPLYLIFSRAVPGNDQMSESVSKALSTMVVDGSYQKIMRRYSGMLMMPTYSIASDYWPPFRMKGANGGFVGIDKDLMEEIGKRLGMKFVWHHKPWARCLTDMRDGLTDVMTGIAYTEERNAYIAYSSSFYCELGPAFYLHDRSLANSIRKYEDLYGITIGYTRGSAYFERFDSDDKLKKKAGARERQLIEMVLAKRWDALVGTDLQVEYDLARLGVSQKLFKAKFTPKDRIKLYLGISRRSKLLRRLPDINAVLDQLIKEGGVENIVDRHLQTLDR